MTFTVLKHDRPEAEEGRASQFSSDENVGGQRSTPARIHVGQKAPDLDDQTGRWDDISDEPVDVDFSSLPSGGIEAEYVFDYGYVHVGLNPGGSIAWKSDDTRFAGGFTEETGGVLAVDVDNSLFLAELHLGGYVRGRLHERITAYAAAGPMHKAHVTCLPVASRIVASGWP